jgi:hypothetical protein
MAYNFAHDVALPGSAGTPLGFLMYPQAETSEGGIDSLDPDDFKYEITSREIPPITGPPQKHVSSPWKHGQESVLDFIFRRRLLQPAAACHECHTDNAAPCRTSRQS